VNFFPWIFSFVSSKQELLAKKKRKGSKTSCILISRKLPVGASSGPTRFPIFFAATPFCPSPRERTACKSTAARRTVYCDCRTRRIRIARIKSREYRRAQSSFSRTLVVGNQRSGLVRARFCIGTAPDEAPLSHR